MLCFIQQHGPIWEISSNFTNFRDTKMKITELNPSELLVVSGGTTDREIEPQKFETQDPTTMNYNATNTTTVNYDAKNIFSSPIMVLAVTAIVTFVIINEWVCLSGHSPTKMASMRRMMEDQKQYGY